MLCKKCGNELKMGAKFCYSCGYYVDEDEDYEDEEEDLCEEFGESWASSYTGVYGSKIADSLTEYDNVDIA